jgi:hypothetical protein
VPQKPTSLSLRIFFIALVWYSFAMTLICQAYFVGILLNPGFEESRTTLNELLQSGIEYGYVSDIDVLRFSDHVYLNITRNQKLCKSMYKCLQRVIERKDFATIIDSLHAEFLRTRLLFHNIHVPLCTLQEDVTLLRISMYMAKGNPLLHRFNKIITQIFEAGLFEKWLKDFMSISRVGDHRIDFDDNTDFLDFATNELDSNYSTFSLNKLQVVFYILLIGQIYSSLLLAVELLYYIACVNASKSTTVYSPQGDK